MPNESPKPQGYMLTESDKALIRGMGKAGPIPPYFQGNIAALHFDGQLLVDMVRFRREVGEKLRVFPSGY